MNPFTRSKQTITSVNINFTNIRSLSTTVSGATNRKITRLLELKCAVNIIIDTKTTIEDVNKLFQSNKLKWKLGHFKH